MIYTLVRLVDLALTNFKSYKDRQSIENLQSISVFIGPNNVGKSNIIKSNLFTRPRNSVLMVEEPEIHLHALAQRSLFKLLKDISQERALKFIINTHINTHSTIFAEISNICGTYLVLKREGISKVRKLEDSPHLLVIKQVLGHENTDLFGYNAVVVIEGDTEDRVIPISR
jgi:predicted ATPase